MKKRRPSLDPSQLGFTFDPPAPARRDAELAGMDRFVAAGVAQALKGDDRSRPVIAGAMSALLSEEVTSFMLDAYASEARENHNIPMHRALALIAVTERFDILDHWLRRVGAAALVGEEIHTARLGHLDRQIAALRAERRALETNTKPIERSGRK